MVFGVHPDDPPRPLMGLPRIVSTEEDLALLTKAVDSHANGVTFCTGSLGRRRTERPCRDRQTLRRRASISSTCATSPRNRTDRSWRPTISAATPTWWD